MAAAALALVTLLLLPLPYKIRGECTAEPVLRRFAVAPYSGLLETGLVAPGEVVREGQLLARMDGREIRWELAGLVAERNRALKQRDASLAAEDVPGAQMARLEVKQLDLKIDLLRHRQQRLEITSPIDGLILSESLDGAESVPVNTGQAICEIAPLDPIEIQVAVPDDEILHVREGMRVEARFDAFPSDAVTGIIRNVHPRSEIRAGGNVFIATVELDNGSQALRPGMHGSATVRGDRHLLGWILLHRPWHWLRVRFGV
jgi:multidrug resistance efflux pump